MQKYKIISIQLTLGLIFILSIMWGIQSTIGVDAVAASTLAAPVKQSGDTATPLESTAVDTTCRYGVSSWGGTRDKNFLQDIGVGWVLDFGVHFGGDLPDGVEYTPMVRFKPELDGNDERTGNYIVITPPFTDDPDGLGPIIAAYPGQLWIIGNEVDRIKWQDDLMPDVYAMAYHDAYHFIKERDPSAQIAISALVEVTPGRLQYLDMVWESYLEKYNTTMPVDVWNMHIYILPELRQDGIVDDDFGASVANGTDVDITIKGSGANPALCSNDDVYCLAEHDDMSIFAQQVVAMRQWMKEHGQQNKPLILSEYSLLNPVDYLDEYGVSFSRERNRDFMLASFDYLESTTDANLGYPVDNNRLVQQWLWFTVYTYSRFSSNLLQEGYTADSYVLEPSGIAFSDTVNGKRPFSINPFISQVSSTTATTITPTGTISATIAATIHNNGDTATTTDTTIRFYADEAGSQLIGTGVVSSGLIGCARNAMQIEVIWDGLQTGVNRYWAKMDGGNTVSGIVIVNPEQAFLPTILR